MVATTSHTYSPNKMPFPPRRHCQRSTYERNILQYGTGVEGCMRRRPHTAWLLFILSPRAHPGPFWPSQSSFYAQPSRIRTSWKILILPHVALPGCGEDRTDNNLAAYRHGPRRTRNEVNPHKQIADRSPFFQVITKIPHRLGIKDKIEVPQSTKAHYG